MTNFEFYKSEIEAFLLEHGNVMFSVIDGTLLECEFSCEKCEVGGYKCTGYCNRKKWLNSEYNPYTIPADTPVDTKVLVSADGEMWYKRYFSHFREAEPMCPYVCVDGGATSWSSKDTVSWRYCKLWEGERE